MASRHVFRKETKLELRKPPSVVIMPSDQACHGLSSHTHVSFFCLVIICFLFRANLYSLFVSSLFLSSDMFLFSLVSFLFCLLVFSSYISRFLCLYCYRFQFVYFSMFLFLSCSLFLFSNCLFVSLSFSFVILF